MRRLSIVHTESSCGWGGQELRVIIESRGLMGRGHGVRIAAPAQSRIFEEAGRRGVPVSALPIARKSLPALLAMRRFLSRSDADIVNTHSSTDSWLASVACRHLGVKRRIVRTRHISAPIPDNAATRWLYHSGTDHIVTTGEALRRQVMRETGLAADRVTSIPTGVDLQQFSPGDGQAARRALGLPAGAFVVGIVATLRSWKGHRFLVEAIAGIADAGVLLAIVGDGPGRDNLRRQVESLGIAARVFMPGQQADVVPWLRAMDVFTLPSYANEGVPQAIVQAMACGLPVVSTAAGAIGEVVVPGVTGLAVAPQDAVSLRNAIVQLRADRALRERLSRAGLEQVRARHGLEPMLDRMETLFHTLQQRSAGVAAVRETGRE